MGSWVAVDHQSVPVAIDGDLSSSDDPVRTNGTSHTLQPMMNNKSEIPAWLLACRSIALKLVHVTFQSAHILAGSPVNYA
ncbi:hypothetical protein N7454_010644 [Penicillium verhagenii]|nr:hypothetical protein N7454_010644 [Penicillium verhagenii]